MTSVAPSTLMVKNHTMNRAEGTARNMFEVYMEASPASTDYTMVLTSYLSNVSTISGIIMSGNADGLFTQIVSAPTISSTTLTFPNAGQQFCKLIGYYT